MLTDESFVNSSNTHVVLLKDPTTSNNSQSQRGNELNSHECQSDAQSNHEGALVDKL